MEANPRKAARESQEARVGVRHIDIGLAIQWVDSFEQEVCGLNPQSCGHEVLVLRVTRVGSRNMHDVCR